MGAQPPGCDLKEAHPPKLGDCFGIQELSNLW